LFNSLNNAQPIGARKIEFWIELGLVTCIAGSPRLKSLQSAGFTDWV